MKNSYLALLFLIYLLVIISVPAVMAEPFGYIDKTGKLVIDLHKYKVSFFNNKFFIAFPESFHCGRALIEFTYYASKFSDEISRFIDKSGNFIPGEFYGAFSFSENRAAVQPEKNGKWGYIDLDGKLIIPAIYDKVESFKNGQVIVQLNNKYGLIDLNGKSLIPCMYDEVKAFSEGLANVKINEKWGYIDINNNIIIKAQFKAAAPFHEGLAAVQLVSNKLGYINKNGKLEFEIGMNYQFINSFSEGLAATYKLIGKKFEKQANQWCGTSQLVYINKEGQEVLEPYHTLHHRLDYPDYPPVNPFKDYIRDYDLLDFHNGVVIIKNYTNSEINKILNTTDSLIDKQGKVLCKYYHIAPFKDGLAAVSLFVGKHNKQISGYIDKAGKVVIQPKFTEADSFHEGLAIVSTKVRGRDRFGYINKSGNWVIKPQFRGSLEGNIAEDAQYFSEGLAWTGVWPFHQGM